MTISEISAIVDVLTRSIFRRDKLGLAGSDEELMRRLVQGPIESQEAHFLVTVSRLLRLMDGLISGRETGEGFVEKFETTWHVLKVSHASGLEVQLNKLREFYEDIQLFCVSVRDREEEPSLFGPEKLKVRTIQMYIDLKQWWLNRLMMLGR